MVYPTQRVSFWQHEPFSCYESSPSQDFFDTLFLLKENISKFQNYPTSKLEREISSQISYLQGIKRHSAKNAIQSFRSSIQDFEQARQSYGYVNLKKLEEDLRALQGISFSLSEANQLISSARTAPLTGLARALESCQGLLGRIHQVFQRTQRSYFLSGSDRKILEKIRRAEPVIANTKEILKRMLQQKQNRIIAKTVASLERQSLEACICKLTKKVQRCLTDENTSSLSKIEQDSLVIKQKMSEFSHERKLENQFINLSHLVNLLRLLEKRNRENQLLKREIHLLMEYIGEEGRENLAAFSVIEKCFFGIEQKMKSLDYPSRELKDLFLTLNLRIDALSLLYDEHRQKLPKNEAEEKVNYPDF